MVWQLVYSFNLNLKLTNSSRVIKFGLFNLEKIINHKTNELRKIIKSKS